jgi:gliding motility-associated-like protein
MRKIFISFIFVFCSYFSFSSHFMGGEITWECIKAGPDVGKYIFQMKVYRDCNGITFSQTSQTLDAHNYPSVGSQTPILLNFISITDISPDGSILSGNNCFDCAAGQVGAVEEYVWRSDPTIMVGTPPAEGWHFTWGSCCRSSNIDNGMSDDPWTLRAVMYPYTDPVTGNAIPADPCFDSSPSFKEQAKTIICTGYEFSYSHNAFDDELDAIEYSWGTPLGENLNYNPSVPNSTALVFSAPYSVNSPIPGMPTLDASTGEITYLSNTPGVFVTCIKVEARKCGQLVAEIYREVQVVLVDCGLYVQPTDGFNDPPTITEAFTDPVTGMPTYETTVYAGQLVQFTIEAEDLDTYAGGQFQEITLDADGGQFASDYVSVNNCANPPCATFNNGAGVTPPFTAPGIVSGVFEWQTDCAHMTADVGCNTTSNVFTFLIKANDDFCPANGISIATIKITVVPPIPDLRCTEVLENGDVVLTWKYVDGAPPTAEPYMVWHSSNPNGPFTLIDSVFFPITTYTHTSAGGNDIAQYYYLSTEEGCGVLAGDLNSDTLASIFINVIPINQGITANLNWNAIHDPLLYTSSTDYELFLKNPNTIFTNILTTPNLNYIHNAEFCDYFPEFYVEIDDASGCFSKSNIASIHLLDTVSPVKPEITDISVNSSGQAVVSWTSSAGADYYDIYKKDNDGLLVNIATVNGVNNTTYLDVSSDASNLSELFAVRAYDTCGNFSDTTRIHNSINLEATLNACAHTITMDWNEYINWTGGTDHYEVVINETTGVDPRTSVRLDGNAVDFVLENIIHACIYDIHILAFNSDSIYVAMSDQLSFIADLPKKPDFNYITTTSVDHTDGAVDISCYIDNTAIISRYEIDRSERETNNFLNIVSIPFPNNGDMIYYHDIDIETKDHFYQYHVFPVDTCGKRVSSPIVPLWSIDTSLSQTILCEADINTDYGNLLFPEEYTNTVWFNNYIEWLGNVSHYNLYRSVNREPYVLVPLHTFYPGDSLLFVDFVSEFVDGNGRFCYYVEGVEGNGNDFGFTERSLSNEVCISQTPKLFVPNTFTPNDDDHNELFKPVTAFVSDEGYSFSIYTRTGELIFNTNNPSKGWDGTFQGREAQIGNYVYHIEYINSVGELTVKTNLVSLVR